MKTRPMTSREIRRAEARRPARTPMTKSERATLSRAWRKAADELDETTYSPEHRRHLCTVIHESLCAIEFGPVDELHVTNLALAGNVCGLLAEMGDLPQYAEVIAEGQSALLQIKDRHRRTGRIVGTSQELLALRAMVTAHDEILEMGPTVSALREVFDKIQAAGREGRML